MRLLEHTAGLVYCNIRYAKNALY